MEKEKTSRVTINMPESVLKMLDEMVHGSRQTRTDAIIRSIKDQKFLMDETKAGNIILITNPNEPRKAARQIVFR